MTTTPNSFIAFPKELFSKKYSNLSADAKMLYSVLLDRVSLSIKNKCVDVLGHVYIIFKQTNIMQLLNWSKGKVITIFKELESFALIERKKQKANLPDLIYVMQLTGQETEAVQDNEFSDKTVVHNSVDKSVDNLCATFFMPKSMSKISTCDGTKIEPPRGSKNELLSNTENIKTDLNNTSINHTDTEPAKDTEQVEVKKQRWMDYKQAKFNVQRQIDYVHIISNNKSDYSKKMLDTIVDLMTNVQLYPAGSIPINGCRMSHAQLQDYFDCITHEHVEYVLRSMENRDNSTYIKNLRAYLATCLFNARSTLDSHTIHELKHNEDEFNSWFKSWKNNSITPPRNKSFDLDSLIV